MERRSFLLNSGMATLATLVPTAWLSAQPADMYAFAEPELLKIINDPDKVQAIGQAYTRSHPEFDSTHSLLQALRPGTSSTKVTASMKQMVQDDFDKGRVVYVNGWVLSQTEARQCALYALLHA